MPQRMMIGLIGVAAAMLLAVTSAAVRWRGGGAGSTLSPSPPPPARIARVEVSPSDANPAALGFWSPIHVCLSPDGDRAYVVNRTADSVSVLDVEERKWITQIPVGRRPTYAVVSPDGTMLYVTCNYDYSVDLVDLSKGEVVRRFPTGYEPIGLALSADGQRLSVVNSLSNTVSIYSTATGERQWEVPVGRVPRYVAETPDGKRLIVGNAHSRDASIIDIASGRVAETRSLGRGTQMRHVVCTPDGRWALLALLVGHDEMITTQMERGWFNSNGISVLDLHQEGPQVTLLLDHLLSGATNPWALAMSSDQRRLYVSLAGIHEVAIVDLPRALQLVTDTAPEQVARLSQDVEIVQRMNIARRVPAGGMGPRGLALSEARGELLVANYFSDAISVLDAESGHVKTVIPLGPTQEPTLWRKGQMYFNDGRICYQNWNSCASCHQEDGTIDSLSWDLLNDGTGNPKNVKSLHMGILTPPAMWAGVRADQDVAVMAGQRFLGFLPDDDIQKALMEFLGKPERAPNPYRNVDPEAIQRGQRLFHLARCNVCHPPPLFTDMKQHDVGLTGHTSDVDFRSRFDTPSLLECYRTAPYLHDGRAERLVDIFTDYNKENMHGLTGGLSQEELDDLAAYLKSL